MNLNSAVVMSSETEVGIIPREVDFFGLNIPETFIGAVVVTLLLVSFALVVRIFFIPKWRTSKSTGGFRMFVEGVVNLFDGQARSTVGHNASFVGPWYFAMGGMICLGTLIEVFGLRPTIADLNHTLTISLFTFIFMIFFGIKEKKVRLLSRYKIVIPVLTDSVVPFSMALRMFGSIYSGYIIMHMFYSLPWFALIGLPAVGTLMFTCFHALIQSYVFMLLSMSFIEEMTE